MNQWLNIFHLLTEAGIFKFQINKNHVRVTFRNADHFCQEKILLFLLIHAKNKYIDRDFAVIHDVSMLVTADYFT